MNMQNKKETVKQILAFMIILVILTGAVSAVMIKNMQGGDYYAPNKQLITFIGMFTPAAAALLARLFTKEGMNESYLGINFKGNEKYYLLSVLLPIAYACTALLAGKLIFGDDILLEEKISGYGILGFISVLLMNLSSCLISLPVYLGEELGWRGYLYPKLLKIMNRPAAYIVGGIIWGLWHTAPIICGLNFGTEYANYPYAGIGLMCILCILSGVMFMWLTEKTGSVYPAAVAHAVDNGVSGVITALVIDGEKINENIIAGYAVVIAALFLFAAVCMVEAEVSDKKKSTVKKNCNNEEML